MTSASDSSAPETDGAAPASIERPTPPEPCLTGRRRLDAALLTALTTGALFAWRAAPGVTFEDAGALAAAAASFGVPHPPGYPLWTLLGGSLHQLAATLGLDPARALVWLSIAPAALACAALAALARSRGAGLATAVAAGWVPALAATFAAQAVVIEVYALAAFFQALLLALALAPIARPRAAWLTFGLGLAAHPGTIVLIALPIATSVRARAFGARALLSSAGALALGLSVYLYVPLAAARHPAFNWGGIDSFEQLQAHLLRAQYATGLERDVASQLQFMRLESLGHWPWLAALAALAAAWMARARTGRSALAILAVTLVTSATLLFLAVNWPLDDPAARARLAGSYVPLVLVVSAWIGLGIVGLEHWLQSRFPRARGLSWATAAIASGAALLPGERTTLDGLINQRGARGASTYARGALDEAPRDALLVVNRLGYSDILGFPLLYEQIANKRRPDVLLIDRGMLSAAWYREQLGRARPDLAAGLEQLAAALQTSGQDPRSQRLSNAVWLRGLLESGAPVVFTDPPGPRIAGEEGLNAGNWLWWSRALDAPKASNDTIDLDWLAADPSSPWTELFVELARARALD